MSQATVGPWSKRGESSHPVSSPFVAAMRPKRVMRCSRHQRVLRCSDGSRRLAKPTLFLALTRRRPAQPTNGGCDSCGRIHVEHRKCAIFPSQRRFSVSSSRLSSASFGCIISVARF